MEFRERAFNNRMLTFVLVNLNHIDIEQFLNESFEYYENEIRSVLDVHASLKVKTCLHLTLSKPIVNTQNGNQSENLNQSNVNDESQDDSDFEMEMRETNVERLQAYQDLFIHTEHEIIQRNMDLHEKYDESVVYASLLKFEEALLSGSGFALSSINSMEIQINYHDPLRGSSYMKTPKFLAEKKLSLMLKTQTINVLFGLCYVVWKLFVEELINQSSILNASVTTNHSKDS